MESSRDLVLHHGGFPPISIYFCSETDYCWDFKKMFDRPTHFSTLHDFIFALDDRQTFSFCQKRLFCEAQVKRD